MSVKERIYHSLLFELTALLLLVPLGSLVSGADLSHLIWVAIALSLTAMLWNYLYNLLFDKLAGENRLERKLAMRITHGVLFEAGLLVVAIPVIMWALQLSLVEALLLDLGFIIFYLLFAIAFNWCYDILRHRLIGQLANQQQPSASTGITVDTR